MAHWADEYVGLPFRQGGRDRSGLDCWGLVRLVWAERFGLFMPRFDGEDDPAAAIAREAGSFAEIPLGELQEGDAVICLEAAWTKSGWVRAPIHIGLVVAAGKILHIHRDHLSLIEPLRRLDVVSARRGPRP